MKIKSNNFIKYQNLLKMFSKIDVEVGSFLYINSEKKEVKAMTRNMIMTFTFEYEGESIGEFVVDSSEFLNICRFNEEFNIDSSFVCSDSNNDDKIQLNIFSNQLYMFRDLLTMEGSGIVETFTFNNKMKEFMKKANCYIDSENQNLSYQTIQIQDNFILSATDGKIYACDLEAVTGETYHDVILHADIVDVIFTLSDWDNIIVSTMENEEIQITYDDLTVIVENKVNVERVTYLSEQFQAMIEKEKYVSIDLTLLETIISFLEFYVSKNENAPVTFKTIEDGKKAKLIVKEDYNIEKLTILNENTIGENIEFIFNILSLKEILNTFYKNNNEEEVKIYTSKNSPVLFIKDSEEYREENILIKYKV